MSNLVHVKECICDFCGQERSHLIHTHLTEKRICMQCLALSSGAVELVPRFSVRCFKCGKYSRVLAVYANATVTYDYVDQDKDDIAVYAPTKVSGRWDKSRDVLSHVKCARCNTTLPTEFYSRNPYVITSISPTIPTSPEKDSA